LIHRALLRDASFFGREQVVEIDNSARVRTTTCGRLSSVFRALSASFSR
jgi:hypothetical protein